MRTSKNDHDLCHRVNLRRELDMSEQDLRSAGFTFEVSSDWRNEPSITLADAAEFIRVTTERNEAHTRAEYDRRRREDESREAGAAYVARVEKLAERIGQVRSVHGGVTVAAQRELLSEHGIMPGWDDERIERELTRVLAAVLGAPSVTS